MTLQNVSYIYISQAIKSKDKFTPLKFTLPTPKIVFLIILYKAVCILGCYFRTKRIFEISLVEDSAYNNSSIKICHKCVTECYNSNFRLYLLWNQVFILLNNSITSSHSSILQSIESNIMKISQWYLISFQRPFTFISFSHLSNKVTIGSITFHATISCICASFCYV